MAINISPEQFADKQATNLKNNLDSMQRGINAVQVNPMEKAAADPDKWLNGIRQSRERWQAGMRKVSLDEWKRAMLEKGIPRVAGGIDAARDKVIAFATKLLPYEVNLQKKIDAMPDTDLEASINRMTTWAREMAKFKA